MTQTILSKRSLHTPLGKMVALADERALYLLEFEDKLQLESQIRRLQHQTKGSIISGYTAAILSIEEELHKFFEGKLRQFLTPICYLGSCFQKVVWEELQKIPFGNTCSYKDLALRIGRENAFRAVARANATNRLAIIIPCHRVINANGALGGYAGGIIRKQSLLNHEFENKLLA